ncbi:MAG: bifunctional 3-(3-hydroxy-phenyl)propionate/3-hydroxycinnamic acid hydroxylase [Burkholderiaceae bacterium]
MHDVVVVGYGPTGAIAAGLLGLRGLSTCVIDSQASIYDKPRAIALDHEIMRVFQQLNILEEIKDFVEPFTDSHFFGAQGDWIKCMSTVAPPYPQTFVPSLVFSQPLLERVLRERIESIDCVSVELEKKVVGLHQSTDHVTLQVQDNKGYLSNIDAKYVIACDGATSTIRGLLGIELEDLGFDEPWLVIDVLVNEKGLKRVPKVSVQYCEPSRPSSYVMGPKNHRRWEISINEGEDPQYLATEEGAWSLLSRWLERDEAVIWRQASYRFHALVAKEWQSNRIFIAGDAAHQQPPFLGQGMCQGIRDACNLVWKMDAVFKNQASEKILSTYAIERKAHVTELTQRIKSIGKLIGERDPQKAMERDRQLLESCGGKVIPTPRQDVQPAITGGCLSTDTCAVKGTLFPQAWIKDGEKWARMDDVFSGWCVQYRSGFNFTLNPIQIEFAKKISLKQLTWGEGGIEEKENVVNDWMIRNGCKAVIVRPDHYVFATCNDASSMNRALSDLMNQYNTNI